MDPYPESWLKRFALSMFVLAVLAVSMTSSVPHALTQGGATEAPTGFDDLTNGLVDQATHDGDRMLFERRLEILDGLGPVYNAQSCAECHQNPRSGGISEITNLRAGHDDDLEALDAAGRLHDARICLSRNISATTRRTTWGLHVYDVGRALATGRTHRERPKR